MSLLLRRARRLQPLEVRLKPPELHRGAALFVQHRLDSPALGCARSSLVPPPLALGVVAHPVEPGPRPPLKLTQRI